jgi:hypothetical protein
LQLSWRFLQKLAVISPGEVMEFCIVVVFQVGVVGTCPKGGKATAVCNASSDGYKAKKQLPMHAKRALGAVSSLTFLKRFFVLSVL